MHTLLPLTRKEEFALAAALEKDFVLEKLKLARFEARMRREAEHERVEEKKRDHDTADAIETALAPPRAIIEFRSELDTYDTKTVEALMENRDALDRVEDQIEIMLGQAQVLPDGRRVFKTQDGKRVFDEHGQEIASTVIDATSIDDKKPKWEVFKGVNDEEARLTAERQALLDYQQRLDAARERLDKGEITNAELGRLKADLAETMPEAVRQKLNLENPKTETAPPLTASASALPNNMDVLMRQTGFAAAVP
ncbi:hypothetical protein SAMN04487976_1085 [Xaviernesmea oryzae]|nr:hypothetical protein SAMN04487976_1085 [Xaviernesmea oryzae]